MAISTQQAADRIHANPLAGQTPNQPMQMSEDAARTMYHNMQGLYPGQNIDQQFIDTMRDHYHQDGAALLKSWATGGTLAQPVAQYHDARPGTKGIPVSELGPIHAGGTPPPGLIASEQGMYVGGTPGTTAGYGPGALPRPGVNAPFMSGYTPPAQPLAAPTTIQPGQTPPGWTPQQAQEMTRLRNITADNFDADAAARRATLPITDQQQFDANNQNLQAFANAPVAAANAKAQGAQQVAQTNAQGRVGAAQASATGRVQAAQAKGLSDQEVAKIRNQGRPASLGKQPESPEEKSLNDRYVAAVQRQRAAVEALKANAPNAQAQLDQAYKDMFAAQQMREDYYSKLGQQAAPTTQSSAQPPSIASEADYNALPAGAKYTYNGQVYTKGQ